MNAAATVVELAAGELTPSGHTYCPNPKAGMKLWNSHPRVYLDVSRSGQAQCPYCSTLYRLKDPAAPKPGRH